MESVPGTASQDMKNDNPPRQKKGTRPPAGCVLCVRMASLTAAEQGVLAWIGQGKRNGEIALIRGCSKRTVDHHVSSILEKLDAETRGVAANYLHEVQWPGHQCTTDRKIPQPQVL